MSDVLVPPDEARAFTVASTNSLQQPHILHPHACNPAMDLAVLLCEPSDEKAKAGMSTLVSLWRLSGAKVWEVQVNGRVLGLTWSADGLILSLLVLRLDMWPPNPDVPVPASKSTVEHISVHDGQAIRCLRVPQILLDRLAQPDWMPADQRSTHFAWWPMEWGGEAEWPVHKPGAPLMIIDSLPGVTPVEPPKPAIINPFAIASAAEEKKKKGLHAKLDSSPSLLASAPASVLSIAEPRRGDGAATTSARLLTGTYLLPSATPEALPPSVLELALRGDMLTRLLDTVFRGFESCAAAFKDADKQTFLWRDELEICGQQQGVSASDVHAELFRFLMTGRPSVPIGEWLGNRLTNRPVAKWDTTVQTGFLTIGKVLAQSVIPALERVLLILEELNGWAHDLIEFDVVLDAESVARAMGLARGLLSLCEDMRQATALEWETAVEWFKWLRYEMNRAISNDDQIALPTHDLKLVWSFLVNGFVNSRFKQHFPNVFGAVDAVLPGSTSTPTPAAPSSLNAVLASTIAGLTVRDNVGSPVVHEPSFNSTFASPSRNGNGDHAHSPPEEPSSPSTVGDGQPAAEGETPREPEVEPWAWANTLLATVNEMVSAAKVRQPAPPSSRDVLGEALAAGSFQDERQINGERWILQLASANTLYVLVHDESDADVLRLARLTLPRGDVVQAAFFGDDEVALVLDDRGRYLAMVEIEDIKTSLQGLVWGKGVDLAWVQSTLSPAPLTPTRMRYLGPSRRRAADTWLLALNANPGRRSGWVLTQGREELVVFDLDANEDEDENEDEEGDEDEEME